MFNFMGDRGSTGEDKRRETLNAYLDNALTPAERDRLESQLARDPALRTELEQLRVVKLQLRAMPRRRVPRSFALDPTLYGRPKAQPLLQLYPALRGATALAAFLLIFVFALGAFRGQFGGVGAPAPAAEISMTQAEEAAAPAESAEEVTPFLATSPAAEERTTAATAASEEEMTAAEAPAEPAAVTQSLTIGAYPPVEGTPSVDNAAGVAPAPEGDLQLPSPAPEIAPTATAAFTTGGVEPTVTAIAEVMATEVAAFEAPAAEQPAAGGELAQTTGNGTDTGLLRNLEIGLGVVFLLLLILWLIARRRVRSL